MQRCKVCILLLICVFFFALHGVGAGKRSAKSPRRGGRKNETPFAGSQPEDCNDRMSFVELAQLGEAHTKELQSAKAAVCFGYAVKREPGHHRAWLELAQVSMQLGRILEARDAFVRSFQTHPNGNFARGLHYAGVLSCLLGEHDKGRNFLRRSNDVEKHAATYNAIAECFFAQLSFKKARASLDKALAIDPNNVDTFLKRAVISEKQGDRKAAIIDLKKASDIAGNGANRGVAPNAAALAMASRVFLRLDDRLNAGKTAREAITIDPSHGPGHLALGMLKVTNFNFEDAVRHFKTALQYELDAEMTIEAHGQLGSSLFNKQRPDVEELKDAEAHLVLAIHLTSQARATLQARERSLGDSSKRYMPPCSNLTTWDLALFSLHVRTIDWKSRDSELQRIQNATICVLNDATHASTLPVLPPLTAQIAGFGPPELLRQLTEISANNSVYETRLQLPSDWTGFHYDGTLSTWVDLRRPLRSITIAYISSDLRDHPVGHIAWFHLHDAQRFHVLVMALNADDGSETRATIERRAGPNFHDLTRRSALEIAQKINSLGVDIVISLNGWSQGNQLKHLSLQPAPIQINVLGSHGTMGATFVDTIGDRISTPADYAAIVFTEKLLLMPHCFFINEYSHSRAYVTKARARATSRKTLGLPMNDVVLSSFLTLERLDPITLHAWSRILRATANGNTTLWTMISNPLSMANVQRELERRGVSSKKLLITEKRKFKSHLLDKMAADFALDRLVYNGHTTTLESLWAAVPVIATAAVDYAARVSASLILATTPAGMTLARDVNEYVELATRLATWGQVKGHIDGLKDGLRRARQGSLMSALWNATAMIRDLETLFMMRVDSLAASHSTAPTSSANKATSKYHIVVAAHDEPTVTN